MRKIATFFLLFTLSVVVNSQESKPKLQLNKENYQDLSDRQKKTAWILTGSGLTLIATAFIIPKGEQTDFNWLTLGYNHKNDEIKAICGLIGICAVTAGTILFIKSGKNNKRAMKMSIKNQPVPEMINRSLVFHSQPVLSLKIPL